MSIWYLYFQNAIPFLQYTYRCYFIHTHKENMAPVLIFMKLKNAKQLGMQITYSEYHLNLLLIQNVWVEIHLCW